MRDCAPCGGVPGLCQPVGVRACGEGKVAAPGLSPSPERAVVEPPGSGEGPRPAAWPLGPSGLRWCWAPVGRRVVLEDGGAPQPAGWGLGPQWSLGQGSFVPGRGAEQGVSLASYRVMGKVGLSAGRGGQPLGHEAGNRWSEASSWEMWWEPGPCFYQQVPDLSLSGPFSRQELTLLFAVEYVSATCCEMPRTGR